MTTLHFNALVPPFDLGEGSGTETFEKSNVLTYGADSTGVADSTTAFKEAGENSNEIYVPPGTYLLATGTPLELKGKALHGAGPQATTLKTTNAKTEVLAITGEGTSFGEITGIKIECTNETPTSGPAIKVNQVNEPTTLRDIFIRNPFAGLEITGGTAMNMSEVEIRGFNEYGVKIHDGPVLVQAINLSISNVTLALAEKFTGIGLWIEKNVEGVAITNCESLFGERGLFMSAPAIETEPVASNVFINCFFDTNKPNTGEGGVTLKNTANNRFTGCWSAPSGGTTGNGWYIEGCSGVTLVNCTANSAGEHGVFLKNSEHVSLIGNEFVDGGKAAAATYDSIHVEEGCSKFTIIGNRFGLAAKGSTEERYGVFIGATTNTDYTIIGNRSNVINKTVLNDNSTTKLKVVSGNTEATKAPKGAAGTLAEAGAAAVKPTANTALNGTVFNLTGSKAKGFVNGALVSFKAVTAGVTNPKTATVYSVIGETANSFELAVGILKTAAFKLTSNTAVAGTVFNLTGAKAKGFVNGSPVTFKSLTLEVTNPKEGTTYFVVGEATNSFELATTIAGAAIKVEGHELVAASTEVQLEATAIKVEGHELETATTEITLEGANADRTNHTRVALFGEVEAEKAVEVKVTVEGNEVGKVKVTKSGAAEPQFVPLGTYDLLPGGKWQVKEVAGLAKVFASTATLNA